MVIPKIPKADANMPTNVFQGDGRVYPSRAKMAQTIISDNNTEQIGRNILQFTLMPSVLMVNPPDVPA
jgi:hypothetical protein